MIEPRIEVGEHGGLAEKLQAQIAGSSMAVLRDDHFGGASLAWPTRFTAYRPATMVFELVPESRTGS